MRKTCASTHYHFVSEPFDLEFKILHEEDPRSALSLFAGIGIDEDIEIEPVEREVAISTKRVDHAYVVKRAGTKEIHHFEATTRYSLLDLPRMLNYVSLLHIKYDLPVYTRIVILTEHGMPPVPPRRYECVGGGSYRAMDVNLVKPWKMPASDALALNRPTVLPWVPLMAMTGGDEQELVRRLAAHRDRDLAGRTAIMAGLRYDDNEELFRRFEKMLTEEMLKQSMAYKVWSAEGREEGLKLGREEGRRQEARRLLARLLTVRFGDLSNWATERLEEANAETLELWSERVLTASSVEEALEKSGLS
ncbi:MAG: DUF4351 domain-containing protein [Bryobacterales bacterium]|nr:DUF4351 domain-containing protein [Bryobacterales bacterium]